ncbi:MAG: ATP-binding protein, partial [Desulfobacterales bacterium]
FLGSYGVARDVTQQKLVETGRSHQRSMETISSLVGGVAHHFNNLFMGIQGCTSLLLSHCRMCARHDVDKLKQIEKLIQDGAELNAQLVGYARGGKYRTQTLNLNELIIRIVESFDHDPEAVHIEVNPSPQTPLIRADDEQISRVFVNLLKNAVQAMPGGGTIRISARPWRLPQGRHPTPEYTVREYVRVQVTDSGIGMSRATLRKAFDPFFSAPFQGRGSGLGLSAAQGIIINHGGIIEAASTPGKGSVFTILLPVARAYDAPVSPP